MNKLLFFLLFVNISLSGDGWDVPSYEEFQLEARSAHQGYERPDTASDEAWTAVQPYLLPADKTIKKVLDRIFRASRVVADRDSLIAAGFTLTPNQGLHVVVAFHNDIKGYLVKVVLDKYDFNNEGKGEDWQQWIQRIEGEKIIRKGISDLGYKDIFKVPRQWIYPLPNGPQCTDDEDYYPKSFIFIVEDMKLESKEKNAKYYRRLEKWEMDAIFKITTKYGLSDCCNRNNLPLCKDGRLAFVDTETYNRWPVNYHQMLQYLSDSGKAYWKKLRDQGGPKKK